MMIIINDDVDFDVVVVAIVDVDVVPVVLLFSIIHYGKSSHTCRTLHMFIVLKPCFLAFHFGFYKRIPLCFLLACHPAWLASLLCSLSLSLSLCIGSCISNAKTKKKKFPKNFCQLKSIERQSPVAKKKKKLANIVQYVAIV